MIKFKLIYLIVIIIIQFPSINKSKLKNFTFFYCRLFIFSSSSTYLEKLKININFFFKLIYFLVEIKLIN